MRLLLSLLILLSTAAGAAVDFGSAFDPAAPQMPGTIEAENFNRGGQFRAYYAETAGNNGNSGYRKQELVDVDIFERDGISFVRSSVTAGAIHEWLNYAFVMRVPGWYEISLRARAVDRPGRVNLLVDDRLIGPSELIRDDPRFADFRGAGPVFLTAGKHNLKLDLRQGGICIDSLCFRRMEDPGALPDPVMVLTPSEIVVADFDVTRAPFLADNSGRVDARDAIQAALDQLGRLGGGTVFLPPGHYRLEKGGLDVPRGVALVGSWENPTSTHPGSGTIIDVYCGRGSPESHPAVLLTEDNSCVRNLSFYYPDQFPGADPESVFRPYPFSIATSPSGWGYTIRNITFLNSFNGIRVSGGSAHTIARIYGTILRSGILTGNGYEFSFMSEVDLGNSFWKEAAAREGSGIRHLDPSEATALDAFTRQNLVGIQLGKNDGHLVYGLQVRDAAKPVLVKRIREAEEGAAPVLRGFWGILSKVKAEIFEVDPYPFPDVHFLNTDLVPETAEMEYSFPEIPRVERSGAKALYHVKSTAFGVIGDGICNDGPSIQKALNTAAAEGGGIVYLPRGQFRVDGHLRVPSGVELRGPHTSVRRSPGVESCVLLAFEGKGSPRAATDPAFITLQANSGIRGFSVVYPEQSWGTALSPYPFTIRGEGENVWVIDVDLENSFDGIDLGSHRCDRHLVSDFSATVFREGIVVGGKSRGGRIQRALISWGPWSGSPRQNAPHRFGKEEFRRQIGREAMAYVFGDSRRESTFGLSSFQQFIHLEVRGDCKDAFFWHSAGDNSRGRNIRVDGSGTINVIGALAALRNRPWLETGPSYKGNLKIFDYLLTKQRNNRYLRLGGEVEVFTEHSLTTGMPVVATSQCRGSPPALAVDAKEDTAWCGDCSSGECSLTVDLGRPFEVFRWEVKNAGYVEDPELNTDSASLQLSLDGLRFETVDGFFGNRENRIDRSFSPARARFVRLKIGSPGADSRARICELSVFGKEIR